jgi:hypothetical protein
LLLSFLFLGAFIYFVLNFSPTFQFSISNMLFPILPIFFILLFTFLFLFFGVLFANRRRGLFIGLFAVIYLLLRMNGLTHPFFLVILIILSGSLELFFVKRK